MEFRFIPMTADFAEEIDHWLYPGVYAFYDLDQDPEDRREFLDPMSWPGRYYAVLSGAGDLVGFFSYEREDGSLLLGLGLRRDLTRKGLGVAFAERGPTSRGASSLRQRSGFASRPSINGRSACMSSLASPESDCSNRKPAAGRTNSLRWRGLHDRR